MIDGIITQLLLKRAARAASQPAILELKSGKLLLPYGKFFQYLAGGGVVGILALVSVFLFSEVSNTRGQVLRFCICSCFVLLALTAINEVFLTTIHFSDQVITKFNRLTRQRREIKWNEISRVRYSIQNHWFIFRATTGGKIRVSRYRTGFKNFCSIAWKNLPPDMARKFNFLVIKHVDPNP